MNDPEKSSAEVLFESRFLRLLKRGRWEYVQRTTAAGAVIIVALTKERCVLFTDQFRIPVNRRTIEFPAGIVGDEVGHESEPLVEAARRELLEETGYEAEHWQEVFTGASSAGLTDELATFFLATGLRRTEAGGGVDSENITVHEVPLAEVDTWLATQAQAGVMLDGRLFSGLYLLKHHGVS